MNKRTRAVYTETISNPSLEIADIDTQLGQFTLSLWGRNLTDEEYFTSAPVVLQTIGAYEKIVTWGEPLTYGIDLVYNFSK